MMTHMKPEGNSLVDTMHRESLCHAIVSHPTFFCKCGTGLDVSRAVEISIWATDKLACKGSMVLCCTCWDRIADKVAAAVEARGERAEIIDGRIWYPTKASKRTPPADWEASVAPTGDSDA